MNKTTRLGTMPALRMKFVFCRRICVLLSLSSSPVHSNTKLTHRVGEPVSRLFAVFIICNLDAYFVSPRSMSDTTLGFHFHTPNGSPNGLPTKFKLRRPSLISESQQNGSFHPEVANITSTIPTRSLEARSLLHISLIYWMEENSHNPRH